MSFDLGIGLKNGMDEGGLMMSMQGIPWKVPVPIDVDDDFTLGHAIERCLI